jgi:hypothetical protein
MSHRTYWALVSVGSASVGLLAAGITVHVAGCGQSTEGTKETKGQCHAAVLEDNNPCTDDKCVGEVVKHDPVADGTACERGMNSGTCNSGFCKLSCATVVTNCACDTGADCPMDTECLKWSCDEKSCKATPQTGTPIAAQEQGDCKKIVCAANGGTESKNDDTDRPDDADACHAGNCQDGTTLQDLRKTGDPCGAGQTGVCDSSSQCVPCLEGTSTGCVTGDICYKTTADELKCTNCNNKSQDTDETDTDCGGVCAECKPSGPCKACDLGKACSTGSDCGSSKPCVDGVCCKDLCTGACKACSLGVGTCDDLPTGSTDPNCPTGRVCASGAGCVLQAGGACTFDTDCMSGVCSLGIDKCAKGLAMAPCIEGTDCKSGTCQTDHTCQ